MFILQSLVQKFISKPGDRLYVLYVDFLKAFDSLVHHKLFTCFMRKGIQGNVLRVLTSMYSKLKSCVRISPGAISSPFACNIGTRQGDLCSPIIFSLYINDLCSFIRQKCDTGIFVTNDIPDIFCILFADDIANCADTAVNLQLQINAIAEFCTLTSMTLNLKKTEVMVFRNGGPLRHYEKWYFNNCPVNTTSVYKYMGILYTPKLCWSAKTAKTRLAAQGRKALFAIKEYPNSVWIFLLYRIL